MSDTTDAKRIVDTRRPTIRREKTKIKAKGVCMKVKKFKIEKSDGTKVTIKGAKIKVKKIKLKTEAEVEL